MAHSSLRSHRKLLQLRAELGICTAYAVGHLQLLWWAVEDCHSVPPSGMLPRWTAEHIARAGGYDGDAQVFVNALVNAGFLVVIPDGGYAIWDYAEWCSKYVLKRWRDQGQRENQARPTPAELVALRPDESQLGATSRNKSQLVAMTQPNPTQPSNPPISPPTKSRQRQVKTDCLWDTVKARFPPDYDTAEVAEAWDAWAQQRAGKRKPLTDRAVTIIVNKSKGWTRDVFLQSVNESYENAWTGIFPPKGQGSGGGLPARSGAYRQSDEKRRETIERFKRSGRYRDCRKPADGATVPGAAVCDAGQVSATQATQSGTD